MGGNNLIGCLPERKRVDVLGSPIDITDIKSAASKIDSWASTRSFAAVCICNVHSIVTARAGTQLAAAIRDAEMATADGAPIAWLMRRVGATTQPRVAGPDLMDFYLLNAPANRRSFLYGSTSETLARLSQSFAVRYPKQVLAGKYSPPFRELTEEELDDIALMINASGAEVVWVGLGCPKQEKWMHKMRGRVNAVLVGVGAAFDIHAGVMQRAPRWMQNSGLEWLYRLLQEPGRLCRRYATTNATFCLLALAQLLSSERRVKARQ